MVYLPTSQWPKAYGQNPKANGQQPQAYKNKIQKPMANSHGRMRYSAVRRGFYLRVNYKIPVV